MTVPFFFNFGNFKIFLHALTFANGAFRLFLGELTFATPAEFQKSSIFRGGRSFLTFQPKDMLNLYFNLNESQPTDANKHYVYKKECTCIPCKRIPFC